MSKKQKQARVSGWKMAVRIALRKIEDVLVFFEMPGNSFLVLSNKKLSDEDKNALNLIWKGYGYMYSFVAGVGIKQIAECNARIIAILPNNRIIFDKPISKQNNLHFRNEEQVFIYETVYKD